ncbi:DUF3299 domain-containing protein [Puniceicoccaceae bacterium K14]|nr:DUF3299 domain-containing protein [Puniceicoccaceae bacterium K14]
MSRKKITTSISLGKLILALQALLLGVVAAHGDAYSIVDFNQLASLPYDPVVPENVKKIYVRDDREYLEQYVPAEVLALDGKPVEIAGYMLPLAIKDEKVSEFLLMADTTACCYGIMPAFNAMVFAKSKKGVNLFDNLPVRIRGVLKVEEVWQQGFFSHLYYLEVEELAFGFGLGIPMK